MAAPPPEGLSNEEVKDYANAVTVTVDLTAHDPALVLKLSVYLGYALYESIRCSAATKLLVAWSHIPRVGFPHTLEDVVRLFLTETKKSIFIHFDEV